MSFGSVSFCLVSFSQGSFLLGLLDGSYLILLAGFFLRAMGEGEVDGQNVGALQPADSEEASPEAGRSWACVL